MTTMTSATIPAERSVRRNSRVIAVTRLIFVNKWTVLYLPVIILLAILALNIAIWLLVIAAADGHLSKNAFAYSGAIFYVFIYMLVLAVQAVSRTFPFALGFGVTRRAFSLGAGLAFVILATVFSVLMTVLAEIEKATGGWGIGGAMFMPLYYRAVSVPEQFFLYWFGLLFCLFLGSVAAAVFVRWRATGLVAFFIVVAILLVGGAALIVLTGSANAVALWTEATGPFGLAAWSLVPTAVFAVVGFLVLQRATPKS